MSLSIRRFRDESVTWSAKLLLKIVFTLDTIRAFKSAPTMWTRMNTKLILHLSDSLTYHWITSIWLSLPTKPQQKSIHRSSHEVYYDLWWETLKTSWPYINFEFEFYRFYRRLMTRIVIFILIQFIDQKVNRSNKNKNKTFLETDFSNQSFFPDELFSSLHCEQDWWVY